MSYLKRLIKSNKGLALESVILLTVVVFAMCSIMTLFSLKTKNISKNAYDGLKERLYLESIGDDYLAYLNNKANEFDQNKYYYTMKNKDYYYTIIINNYYSTTEPIELIVKDSSKTELCVKYEKNEETQLYYPIKWTYGD